MMNFDKMCKVYEDIVELKMSCDHYEKVSKIIHWFSNPDYLSVFSAGEFWVNDNEWDFDLPKFKEVENADGMIHLHTKFLLPNAKDWDEVEEKDFSLNPASIADMKVFLALISKEITIRNDWSLVFNCGVS
jgi:hypothetical protein